MKQTLCVVGAVVCAGVVISRSGYASVSVLPMPIETIAASGGIAPGGGALVYGGLGSFSFPRLNNLGEVVYTARLTTTSASGTFVRQGLWAATPQNPRLIFLQDGAIATPSGPFSLSTEFSVPTINDVGSVATTCNGAVLVSTGGVGQVVIKNGDPVASPAGTAVVSTGNQFEFGANPILTNTGGVALRIGVSGSSLDPNVAVLSGVPGSLSTRLAFGPSPALGSGVNVDSIGNIRANSNGAVVSAIGISMNGGNSLRAIARVDSGGPQLVAVQGAHIPGQAAGASFSDLSDTMAFNDQATVVFAAHATGFGGVTEALFASSGGITAPVVTRGQAAPGLAGVRFGGSGFFVLGTPSMNASGKIAFQAQLQTTGGQAAGWGIFAGDANGLSLIAGSGGDAGFGQTFQDNSLARSMVINGLGEVALLAGVSSNQVGLFATDTTGLLHRIIAQGDTMQVSPGVFKQVSLLRLQSSPNESGVIDPHTFNDLGQIAFFARFTDNTEGIFRTTVPAPAGTAAGLIAAGIMAGRRRRAR